MCEYHLLGAGSPIAQLLAKKLGQNNDVNLYSKNKKEKSYEFFLSSNLDNSVVIYFCNIKDDLQANINFLKKIIYHCKKFNCKLFFISSINAELPSASLYSKIKFECEKIVTQNKYFYIRLAIVVSDPPFSSYKALNSLIKIPIKLEFNENQLVYFTKIDDFLSVDFKNLNSNLSLYSYSLRLNSLFLNKKFYICKINVNKYISFLKLIDRRYKLKSVFGKILTLTAFNKKI